MPTLYVVAGPNGCGKSTLTRMSGFSGFNVIDPDAIMRGMASGTLGQAAREALRRRWAALRAGGTHLVETTLAGSGVLRHMKTARAEGYRIVLHYVSVNSPEQALDRIRNRVALGGHDVPEPDVRRRFVRSQANLPAAVAQADEVLLYDNSSPDRPHREVAILGAGTRWIGEHLPDWVAAVLACMTRMPATQERDMGVVYVLTNRAMPGFVKIGHTTQTIEDRIRSLNNTGVPYPFDCEAAWEFGDAREVEKILHKAFADRRVEKREFFEMDASQVVVILEGFGNRDVTPSPRSSGGEAPRPVERRSRRSNFKFSMIGVEPDAVLISVLDDSVSCRVVDDRRVEFEGATMSLSAAAKRVVRGRGMDWKTAPGPDYWMYGDPPRTLAKLRDEMNS